MVGERDHFLKSVRHIEHRDAVTREPPSDADEPFDLLFGERFSRLVQNEELRPAHERLSDHDRPLIRDRELAGEPLRPNIRAQALEHVSGGPAPASS